MGLACPLFQHVDGAPLNPSVAKIGKNYWFKPPADSAYKAFVVGNFWCMAAIGVYESTTARRYVLRIYVDLTCAMK